MTENARAVPCATCGKSLDAFRAARVRFTDSQQWFFCSAAHADEFSQGLPAPPKPQPLETGKRSTDSTSKGVPEAPLRTLPANDEDKLGGLLEAPLPYSPLAFDTSRSALDFLPTEKPATETPFSENPLNSLNLWAPVALALVGGLYAAATGEPFYSILAAGLILALTSLWGQRQTQAWQRNNAEHRQAYLRRLSTQSKRITPFGLASVVHSDLRPGEEVLVLPGDLVPADGLVAQGRAEVELWEGARDITILQSGDRVVAGARVISGELRITCSKTGDERAFSPMLRVGDRSIAERTVAARFGKSITREGAVLVGALLAFLYFMQGSSVPVTLSVWGVMWASLSHPIARALPSSIAHGWLGWAARQGICFSHETLVDRAGTVTVAALCARGTVLHGEPEVAEIHALRNATERDILSLAAGAESVVHHPVAAAVLRAARTRDVEIDSCRSHNATPGMGVKCVSSTGDFLVLGSRELLLREKLSIALAEETLRSLESRGLSALMLSKNGHLIGVIALQDSLRAGAKAAVQILVDERIEPVLISGDSRATTEAVAHALAIEHVRPEIPTSGRAREIESLIEAGATVAVIGISPRDDAALGAAPVPIVLDGASLSWRDPAHGRERAIGTVGRKVIAGPLALLAARRIRSLGVRSLVLSLLPAGFAVAATTAFLAPLFVPPLVATAAAALAMRLCLKRPEAGFAHQ